MNTTDINVSERAKELENNAGYLSMSDIKEVVTWKYPSVTIRLAYTAIALACKRNVFHRTSPDLMEALRIISSTGDHILGLRYLNDSSDVIRIICKYGVAVRQEAEELAEEALLKRKEAAKIIESTLYRSVNIDIPLKWIHYADRKVILMSERLQPISMVKMQEDLAGMIKKCQLMRDIADVPLVFSSEQCPYDLPERTGVKKATGKKVLLELEGGSNRSPKVTALESKFVRHLTAALKREGIDLNYVSEDNDLKKSDFGLTFSVDAVDSVIFFDKNDDSRSVAYGLTTDDKVVRHTPKRETYPWIGLTLNFPYPEDERACTSKIDYFVSELSALIAAAII